MRAMKKYFVVINFFIFLSANWSGAQPAQPPGQSGQTPSQTAAAIENLIGGYGIDQIHPAHSNQFSALLYQSNNAAYDLLLGNTLQTFLQPLISNYNVDVLANNPNYVPNSANSSPTLSGQAINDILANPTNPGTTLQISAPVKGIPPAQNAQPGSPTANLDLNSLMLPVGYDISTANPPPGTPQNLQQTSALNFILFATGLASPLPVLDFSNIKDPQSVIQNNAAVQAYLIAARIFAAQQSVGTSNLYQLYAERVPVSTQNISNIQAQQITSGTGLALKQIPQLYPKASPLMVDQYMATRRFTNPQWAQNIQTQASPAELSRQELYLLREIRYELFMNRMVNERILATLSVIELQGAQTQAVTLSQLYKEVTANAPFGSSSNGTSTGTGG